jgi:hypothetical protein
LNKTRRDTIIEKRVKEYTYFLKSHTDASPDKYTPEEMKSFKQIELDMPRTAPRANVFCHPKLERVMHRISFSVILTNVFRQLAEY